MLWALFTQRSVMPPAVGLLASQTRRVDRRSRSTEWEVRDRNKDAADSGMTTTLVGQAIGSRVVDATRFRLSYPGPVGRMVVPDKRLLCSIQAQTVPIANQKYQLNDK
jgi:hypothetical protein